MFFNLMLRYRFFGLHKIKLALPVANDFSERLVLSTVKTTCQIRSFRNHTYGTG